MQTEATIQPRDVLSGIEMGSPDPETVYLLPTAWNGDGRHAYMGADAILLKQAAAKGVDVAYAMPEEDREFVEHFSSGIELVTLAVAIVSLVPSTIQGIHALIQLAARRKGIKDEDLSRAQVKLKIDYLRTPTTKARGVEISGDVDGVVSIMERLSGES